MNRESVQLVRPTYRVVSRSVTYSPTDGLLFHNPVMEELPTTWYVSGYPTLLTSVGWSFSTEREMTRPE